ncbi:unnamed protein product [Peronospora belbahrii]|nr:unnamed protein product [Peronospora belbahrii]
MLCAEGLFGGTGAIGVKGNDAIAMFEWEELRLIRKIDVVVKNAVVAQSFAAGTNSPDESIDGAFDLLHKISEKVDTGTWVGDCLMYTNAGGRLDYYAREFPGEDPLEDVLNGMDPPLPSQINVLVKLPGQIADAGLL